MNCEVLFVYFTLFRLILQYLYLKCSYRKENQNLYKFMMFDKCNKKS